MRPTLCVALLAVAGVSMAQRANTRDLYDKAEYMIPMRDGVKLYTAVYTPKKPRAATNPMLMERTPYGCWPYGPTQFDQIAERWASRDYIIVNQDVRGRYLSEGDFEELRPQLQIRTGKWDTDESTDTYDTIEFLTKKVAGNNGRVGIMGISYPGGYAALAALSGHPALRAVSPQAPTTDWFVGDDVHHLGAFFLQDNASFMQFFTPRGPEPTLESKGTRLPIGSDSYKWFLELGPIKNIDEKYFKFQNHYWTDIMNNPDYNHFWTSRAVQHQLRNVKCAMLNVGGLFDAEDCYGPQACYRENEKNSPASKNHLVLGPWSHGMWASPSGDSLGDQKWGSATSKWYQDNVEVPFFETHLRGDGKAKLAEATVFDSGAKKWSTFTVWPPKTSAVNLVLNGDRTISIGGAGKSGEISWTSDPANPVPYQTAGSGGRKSTYMLADQRFVSGRADVITFVSAPLTKPLTLAGDLEPVLRMKTSGTDMDVIVKLIDQYPDDAPTPFSGGYQMLVRGEVLRGKYRNSLSNPRPFVPGAYEEVRYKMPQILHTFAAGHRVAVQVQSSWFPLVDRNPHKFLNIYQANEADFVKAEISLACGGGASGSHLAVGTLP
ncbi:MAG: CocE/NonD family hydrolase [Chthonomonas sp.]|nr:CocE/NonD family hydrolase [Chthonomonas sp.]